MVSAIIYRASLIGLQTCLNPYYTGRWFLLFYRLMHEVQYCKEVLILIILEDGFCFLVIKAEAFSDFVLILIILEDGFC